MSMVKEFRDFAMRGNVIDLAVGVIIGAAFGKIVSSLVNDIFMPPIGRLLGKVDFSDLFLNLDFSQSYPSIAAAKAAGAPVIAYGAFLNTVIEFTIVAFCVFMVVKQVNRFKARPAPAEATTKECPQCAMTIPLRAHRCPNCTSQIA
jgi:large conductance mechanosensitive channel